jgi:hypothetical protein
MRRIKRRARDPSIEIYLRLRRATTTRPTSTAAPMANNAICSGSGTGVGVPPDEPPLLLPPVEELPPVLLPPHLPNQHHQVACAGAGTATPIKAAAPAARNILLRFMSFTLFAFSQ